MKRTNAQFFVTASLFVIFGHFSNASASERITLKGLSAASTVTEIESVFGPCGTPDANGWHYCGGSDLNSYKENEDGEILQIFFHCSLINACDHPVSVLAQMIKSQRNEIIEIEVLTDALIQTATLYGVSGDTLVLQSFQADGRNAILSLNAGNQVSLD